MKKRSFPVRTLVSMALLAALTVVLRLLLPALTSDSRFSLESVPVAISGILFGPFAGALTGLVADAVGCLFDGYGWNPIFCISPILYGVLPGLLRSRLKDGKLMFFKLLVVFLLPAVFGSVLWQSFALSFMYGKHTYAYYLIRRSVQFAVTVPLDAVVTSLIFASGAFKALKLWPPSDTKKRGTEQ